MFELIIDEVPVYKGKLHQLQFIQIINGLEHCSVILPEYKTCNLLTKIVSWFKIWR